MSWGSGLFCFNLYRNSTQSCNITGFLRMHHCLIGVKFDLLLYNIFVRLVKSYIYIFIAIALDETSILVVVHFSMKNIYQSCDLGRAVGRNIVDVSQSLFTEVCVTLVTYHHDIKYGSSVLWLFQDLRQAVQNPNYSKIHKI